MGVLNILEFATRYLKFKASSVKLGKLPSNPRFKKEIIHAKSLEVNPLHSPADRAIRIYLPPSYEKNHTERFPVIYCLSGYGTSDTYWYVTPANEVNEAIIPIEIMPKDLVSQANRDRLLCTFEQIDKVILEGTLSPLIFVQVDGSLQIPQTSKNHQLNGPILKKGSFYANSITTGNYMDYIIKDVINHIDTNYRTIADKTHRGLVGHSMGGYGALNLGLHHSEYFNSIAVLSPYNPTFEFLDWTLIVPYMEKIVGFKIAKALGKVDLKDLQDSINLIFFEKQTIQKEVIRNKDGKITGLQEKAQKKWDKIDLNVLIRNNPDALKKVNLLLYCDGADEFACNIATSNLHNTLEENQIPHQYIFGIDPEAALSPHSLGGLYHILPSMQYIAQNFKN